MNKNKAALKARPSPYLTVPDNIVKNKNFTIIVKTKIDRRRQYGAVRYETTLVVKALDRKLRTNVKNFKTKGHSNIENIEDLSPRVKEYLSNLYGDIVNLPVLV